MLPLHPNLIRLFDWVWQTSAKVSVLIILLLLVKTVLKTKISARLHYLLWSVVIVGLLLPWTPQSSLSLYNLVKLDVQGSSENIGVKTSPGFVPESISGSNKLISTSLQPVAIAKDNSGEAANSEVFQYRYKNIIESIGTSPLTYSMPILIWIMGIAFLLIVTISVNRRFAHRIQDQSVNDSKLLSAFDEAKQKLNLKGSIPLILTKVVTTPSLFGLFYPKLLIPVGVLDEFGPVQLNHIFTHELLHLKRRDIMVNWLIQGLLTVHWFNPIFWYAFYRMREDQEISCDAKAMEYIGVDAPKEYANTLIKLAESNSKTPKIAGLASLSGSGSQIKRRIKMIKDFPNVSLKWSVLAVSLAIVLVAVTLTNAKASTSSKVETVSTVTNVHSGEQIAHYIQSSSAQDGSFDYHKYLSFTPLLPSYTAGYQLTDSELEIENDGIYLVKFGANSELCIFETCSNSIHQPDSPQSTKTQIQIGGVSAKVIEDETVPDSIQFTKNNVVVTLMNMKTNLSINELKKICESLVPVSTPPTNIYFDERNLPTSDKLSFKTLQPSDIVVPEGYKFQWKESNIHYNGNDKLETCTIEYSPDSLHPSLDVLMYYGDRPFESPISVLISGSNFDTKQIDGTEVKLRKTQNDDTLPAAIFTYKNGLKYELHSQVLPESEIEKVVTSILEASAKL
ncbi:M56 family metallopeptidase [Desulfosporosinus sp. SYSU MS00001]